MLSKVFKIWCEWDIGHSHEIFTTPQLAKKWCEKNLELQFPKDPDYFYEELQREGLVGIQELNFHQETL